MKNNALTNGQSLNLERSAHLFCDTCEYYPIEPVHGHFQCPNCHAITKCCELGPMNLEGAAEV